MNKDKKYKRKRTITLGTITPATRNKLCISNFKIRYQVCNVKALPRDSVANTSNSIQLMSSPEQIKSTSRVCIPPDHRHINADVEVATKSHTTGCNIKDKATQYRNLLQTKHKLHIAIRFKPEPSAIKTWVRCKHECNTSSMKQALYHYPLSSTVNRMIIYYY